jgi:two-component system, chemotaxis family, protein-glutamate methylesterase/glutaminase
MTRVLIVDDSSFMRKSLTHLLESDPALEVVETAADGADAVRKVRRLRPDVVLLDIEMSGMNGLVALAHIMDECPTPVLVLSGLDPADRTLAVRCLEQGAVDFLPKPSGVISYDIDRLRAEIVARVKQAAEVHVRQLDLRLPGEPLRPRRPAAASRARLVVIGASTGGPRAVATVVAALPPDLPAAVLVVQHMSAEFVPSFAERLKWDGFLEVAVARPDEPLVPGRVVVAPGGCRALVAWSEGGGRVRLGRDAPPQGLLPSVDDAMASAAEAYGAGAVGVLLTGMGDDGARGMKAIKDRGGRTLAEDPSTCLVSGMPRAAIDLGGVDQVVPLPLVAQAICKLL